MADVIKAGADYAIVGRAMYEAREPRNEAERVASEIEETLGR